MSLPPGAPTGPPPAALELPPFSLDVEALELGAGVKAVGLELVETENREPVRGKKAAEIWSAIFPALAFEEFYVCLLYTSPSPRDGLLSRMPSSA